MPWANGVAVRCAPQRGEADDRLGDADLELAPEKAVKVVPLRFGERGAWARCLARVVGGAGTCDGGRVRWPCLRDFAVKVGGRDHLAQPQAVLGDGHPARPAGRAVRLGGGTHAAPARRPGARRHVRVSAGVPWAVPVRARARWVAPWRLRRGRPPARGPSSRATAHAVAARRWRARSQCRRARGYNAINRRARSFSSAPLDARPRNATPARSQR